MNPLFVFAVDMTLPRGDSTHVREFVHHISRQCPASTVFTYNDVRVRSRYLRLLIFRLRLLLRYLVERRQKVYLRYFPAIFVDMLLLRLLGREVYIELNAVISDEAQDLGRPWWLRLVHKLDEKCICSFSKALVAVTPEIRRYYVEEYGKRETVVVNNGVNTELFDPARAGFPSDMSNLRGRFVVGFVGSLSPWQDFATLIDAMDVLVRRRGLDDIRCVIIGSGAEEGFIRQRIADLGLEKYIIMAGRRKYEEIPDYVSLFSVAVAPLKGSRNKNTGSAALKVFEYLSMAKPLVLSEVGSLSDMIRAQGVGLVYRSSDPDDLADRIIQIHSGSVDTVSMTARSRELVENDYSWTAAVRDTVGIMGLGGAANQ